MPNKTQQGVSRLSLAGEEKTQSDIEYHRTGYTQKVAQHPPLNRTCSAKIPPGYQ